jgi:5-methylcytosine-specific restriction enzyme subunit McrC
MRSDLELTESKPASLKISSDEASLLSAMGRELASAQAWWGNQQPDENRSVIDVKPAQFGGYTVTFREVIGLVQLGKLRIRVVPKIPWHHFVYIASQSEFSPRISSGAATVGQGFEFTDLLCRWFVESAERLVRVGLRQDYSEVVGEIPEVRGRLLIVPTATEVLKGRAVASCAFDELSTDTPLNRIIRAAGERASCLPMIGDDTRRRARRLVYRMDGVGSLLHSDRRLKPDRLSQSYVQSVSLARLILDGCGISLSDGKTQGTSFLVRTPELIEDGLRSIIAMGLPNIAVKKRPQILGDSGISMNPDIVFGDGLAIADVKYKYFERDWNRPDFNQIVAFATGFGSRRCALIGFIAGSFSTKARVVRVGPVEVTRIAWPVGGAERPESIAKAMVDELADWLN